MDDFKTHIAPIITKFMKSRQTKFAKSKNVSIENIHAHNQLPIWFLIKQFKSQNNIRSRLFRSLTDEQKIIWFDYYDQHKQLVLMTTAEHEQFHKSHIFDIKSGEWKNINPSIEPEKSKASSHVSSHTDSKASSHVSSHVDSKASSHASVEDSNAKANVKQMKSSDVKVNVKPSKSKITSSVSSSVEDSNVKSSKSKTSSTHKRNLLNDDSGDSSENETNEKHVERNKNEVNKSLTHSPAHSKPKKKV